MALKEKKPFSFRFTGISVRKSQQFKYFTLTDYSRLEKQLCDWRYSLLEIEQLNELIQENFLDNFIQFNQENDDNCDSIDRVI